MGFIEKLKQEDAVRAQQLHAQKEAQERERLQKEETEKRIRTQRKEQAERFRQESGVKAIVDKLAKYLETPTIPIVVQVTRDGFTESETEYRGRGTRGLPNSPVLSQRDQDSVLNTVYWDHNTPSGYGTIRSSYKYIAVESCPDGTIVFHGDWKGSTTLRTTEWKIKDKEQVLDRALEKAFKNPRTHRYSFYRQEPLGCG